MTGKVFGVIALAVGVIVLFAGDAIAGIGQAIDNLVASKWTGAALIATGLLILGVETQAFKKI